MAAPLPNDGVNEVGDSWDTKCTVAFTKGPWRHIIEYGVRQDGEDEPYVCQTSNEHLEPGPLGTQVFAYQAAYALLHGNLLRMVASVTDVPTTGTRKTPFYAFQI